MRFKRFSFFFMGILAITTYFVAGGAIHEQVSQVLLPGPLSAQAMSEEELGGFSSHAQFEQDCRHCHAPVHCLSDTLCQDCHQDIARQREESWGLHGVVVGSGGCENCHQEHQGRDHSIIAFAYKNVNHEVVSPFSLVHHQTDYDGAPLDCHQCHDAATWTATEAACAGCHDAADPEFAQVHEAHGEDCLTCHDGRDRLAGYDHEAMYPLAGAHATVACAACHEVRDFSNTPTACAACHEYPEVHGEQFGGDCARCHTDHAWQPAQLIQHRFELRHGSEEPLSCQQCHVQDYLGYRCDSCHEHNQEHLMAVHLAADILTLSGCGDCHPTGAPGEAQQIMAQMNAGPPETVPATGPGPGDVPETPPQDNPPGPGNPDAADGQPGPGPTTGQSNPPGSSVESGSAGKGGNDDRDQ